MKLNEAIRHGYLAYAVPELARNELAKMFPPKFPDFIGHHITKAFGVPEGASMDEGKAAHIKVIGYALGDGIEALVCEVDGSRVRPDGKVWHITWSLDKSKGMKPVMSNDLIMHGGWTAKRGIAFPAILTFYPLQ